MDPVVLQANITKSFRGLTYRFFNDYSDVLRQRIFGPAEAERQKLSSITYMAYSYPDVGIIVRIAVTGSNHAVETPDYVELDFVTRP